MKVMAQQGDSQPRPLSVRRNMLFNTIGSLAYQGCLWLTTVLVVTLSHGYGDSGILALAMAVGNMFNPIATYSMRTYQVSDMEGEYTQATYVTFRIVTIGIGAAFIVPYTFITCTNVATAAAVLIYLVFKTDEAFADVLYGVDQRGERMDYIGISQFVRGVLILAAFASLLSFTGSLNAAVAGMSVAGIAMTFAYDLPHARRFQFGKLGIMGSQVRMLLVRCLPIVVSTLLLSMVVSISRQCFSWMNGEEALGEYAAVATPAVLIQAAARYLYSPVLVPLAERWEKADKREFSRYLGRSIAVLVLGVAIMAAVLFPLGGPLLQLAYGPSIEPFVYLFPYVLVSTGFVALMWFLTDVLTICRKLRELLVANAVAFCVCLASMIPLEQGMGMNGINLTVIVAMAVGAACAGVLLHRAVRSAAAEEADGRAEARPSSIADDLGASGEVEKVLVSVIVPVYNAERYLDRCLSSALTQTHANVEVICVDDGSTDGSSAVLARWAEKEPNRVQVIPQENAGVAAARNRGFEAARGTYVTYLDNDDYFDPDLVESLLSVAVKEDLDVVCSGYRRPDATGNVVAEVVPTGEGEWERFMVTAAWSKLFRRSYLAREGISFLDTNIGEDAFFSIPALVLTSKIRVVPYCGYNWFYNEDSVSNTKHRTSNGLRFERTLDDVLDFIRGRDVRFNECLTHYFVRFIVWFLFYTARGDGAQTSRENVRHYEAWLDSQLPGWRDDPLARPSRPQGDMLSSRVSTWLFVRHPGLFRLMLAAYRRF